MFSTIHDAERVDGNIYYFIKDLQERDKVIQVKVVVGSIIVIVCYNTESDCSH